MTLRHQRASVPTILSNATLVLPNDLAKGALMFGADIIDDIDLGTHATRQGIDCEGDFVMPGLVELHTDNVERHFMPRPKVYWPNHLAAVMAHDSEIIGAGITTVFDALAVGDYDGDNSPRRDLYEEMVNAVTNAAGRGLFKADHRLHLRCELSDPRLMETLTPIAKRHRADLVSLMDHTPGQRQWRDLDALRTYMGRTGMPLGDIDRSIQARQSQGDAVMAENWRSVIDLFAGQAIAMASHDDTTIADVDQGLEARLSISEFPCTIEAAHHAVAHGMKTIGGAPNIVRGGSHSGNVAVAALAAQGLLNALSSDFVPTSLLQAPFILAQQSDLSLALPAAIAMVTSTPAQMVGLLDRGVIAVGKRADLIRVRVMDGTPIVRAVYRGGQRVC